MDYGQMDGFFSRRDLATTIGFIASNEALATSEGINQLSLQGFGLFCVG